MKKPGKSGAEKGKQSVKEIQYIRQPTEYLCGQACVAMIAGVPVDDVIRVMKGKTDNKRSRRFCVLTRPARSGKIRITDREQGGPCV